MILIQQICKAWKMNGVLPVLQRSYVTLSAYSIRSNITQMEAFVPDEAADKVHWFVVKCLWYV